MPRASVSIGVTAAVEVWCGNCNLRRLPEDDPRAVVCSCGKTVDPDSLEGED